MYKRTLEPKLLELKKQFHHGLPPNVYFWRDKMGVEVDCILEEGSHLEPIEVKSTSTIQPDLFDGLTKWCNWAELPAGTGTIVYGGEENQLRKQGRIMSWKFL